MEIDIEYLKIIIGVCLAFLGWWFSFYIKDKIGFKSKTREKRIDFLINTYLKLENSIKRDPKVVGLDLERVFAEIQLMGNEEQIFLSKQLIIDLSENGSMDLEELLKSLRKDLRNELGLKEIDNRIQYLRMTKSK